MQYFEFDDVKVPLSCVMGFSYAKSGNIVPTSHLNYKCTGINPIQVQVQFALNRATCYDMNFIELVKQFSATKPLKSTAPSVIHIANQIVIPQLEFMLTSTNLTYQSDRLGNLQELQVSWTLTGTRVIKNENRDLALKSSTDSGELLPKVILHCKGNSVECSQDISIADLRLGGFKGSIQLLLADTYTQIDRDSWLADVNNSKDSHFEIEGYGKFYILESHITQENWLNFELTRFSKEWYQKRTETFISEDGKLFTLNDIFNDVLVKSKAQIKYFKYDDTPYNVLFNLQECLGYLIGFKNNRLVLYDVPDVIDRGSVTYDYPLDNDLMTALITKVILRDGLNEYISGTDDGETLSIDAICSIPSETSNNVLKYAQFNQHMLVLTIPLDKRMTLGSIVNVNLGDKIVYCVCTQYDIDFLSNQMTIELHYTER